MSLDYSGSLKLLTEFHFEFLNVKGGCIGSSVLGYTCQNATLLEITCHSLFCILIKKKISNFLHM